MGRRPAEMLGVAELACQIFLKEIVIGSVRHTSEKLSQRRLEGLAFGPSIGSIIVALTGQQRASVWIGMPDSREASCLWLHERICDLAGRHLLRNAILWMGAFVVQATSLVAASNPQLPVPGT